MKRLVLVSVLALAAITAAAEAQIKQNPTYYVQVMGRLWSVQQVSDEPVTFEARRGWNNLNAFDGPSVPRTIQATRAFEYATGCKVIRSTMYQTISGYFFTQVACN